jgi:hypothetical protein
MEKALLSGQMDERMHEWREELPIRLRNNSIESAGERPREEHQSREMEGMLD